MGHLGGTPGREHSTELGDPGSTPTRILCPMTFPSLSPYFLSIDYQVNTKDQKKNNLKDM